MGLKVQGPVELIKRGTEENRFWPEEAGPGVQSPENWCLACPLTQQEPFLSLSVIPIRRFNKPNQQRSLDFCWQRETSHAVLVSAEGVDRKVELALLKTRAFVSDQPGSARQQEQ